MKLFNYMFVSLELTCMLCVYVRGGGGGGEGLNLDGFYHCIGSMKHPIPLSSSPEEAIIPITKTFQL